MIEKGIRGGIYHANLWCVDTDIFIIYIKTEDTYSDIATDVETRSDTSNYDLDRPLTKEKNNKLMNDKLGGKIMTELAALSPKPNSYLTEDNDGNKKHKVQKVYIKRKLKYEDYKHCLKANQLENKANQLEKDKHEVKSLQKSHKEFQKTLN